MVLLRLWLLILFVLVLGGEAVFAASARENRAYAAAVGAFNYGDYERAASELAQFVEKYPASSRVAEAVLLRAQAEFKQGKLADAIALLISTNNLARAGAQADEYVYWTGAAQLQGRDFASAAKSFLSLSQNFPKSRLRLRAVVEASAAFTELRQWPEVVGLLSATNGVFQQAMRLDAGNDLVARGQLLLAQAKFAQGDFPGTAAVLESMNVATLAPELDWQRIYLLCQARLAAGETDAALAATTNLLQIGRLDLVWRAEGIALHAEVLEQLGRVNDAAAAYRENLATNVPALRQRQAALKIAALAIGQNEFSNAVPVLETFLAQFPDSPTADTVLLTLGELHLKAYVAQPADTNQLAAARERFEQFIGTFTNSPLLGLAHLNRGWSFWLAGNAAKSLGDFTRAAQLLPPSEDLAVARFKAGDGLFTQKDFAGALENYQLALENLPATPASRSSLGDRVWYQILRASLELKNVAGATNALAQILEFYPASELAPGGALLVGESQTDLTQPANARALFEKFAATFPDSALRAQAELSVARTYEQQADWPAAVGKYESWLKNFPTNALQAQVSYALALANFQAGSETNAYQMFTNFVAQFPTNELAPLAQWWVADYFFRQPDPVNAERNYKFVFEKWPASDLAYPARMMAGRAAVARLDYNGAIRDYFIKLEPDTNCPIDLRVQATFAHGAALMLAEVADTNQPLANFQMATNLFAQICQLYPTNELGALAWGEIGNCALQLSSFAAATNAYAQVFNSPYAGISARSQAQIGFGIALEKMAALQSGDDQRALLKLALDNYLAVFDSRFADNDPFWVKKAGLQALPLVVQLGLADPDKFINALENLFPQLKESLDKKRAALLAEKK